MKHLHASKTKIVATLGPNSDKVPVLEKMLEAGMNVARLNMSHGDYKSHAASIANARRASARTKRPLAILQDLSGPKIRIGDFSTETVTLENNAPFTLTTKKCIGDEHIAHVNYIKLPKEVSHGMHIYLNDGKLKLFVEKVEGDEVYTTVLRGGTIRGRRGVNIPDADLSIPTITKKDKEDLLFGLEQKVDFITLSFVRTAKDIHDLRVLIGKKRSITIIAKIETRSAIENIDAIVDASDVIMVARGDLAIEMPPEKVPLLQKKIIRIANRAGKPVITATQMLDSMRVSTTPTRAEVNDIANAILDGTDAIMLSDETAVGLYPERAIAIMSRVAHEVETDPFFIKNQDNWDFDSRNTCDAVSRSIVKTATSMKAKAIVALSESGYTGRMVARYRPRVPILVLTPNKETYIQSLVTYGCLPALIHKVKNLKDAQKTARKVLLESDLLKEGDVFVLGAGIPFGEPGATNMMLVEKM
jgi:pyruvate kinase